MKRTFAKLLSSTTLAAVTVITVSACDQIEICCHSMEGKTPLAADEEAAQDDWGAILSVFDDAPSQR